MKNYFETKQKNKCNGCGACELKCPKNAIRMEYDEEGFLYPIIDKNKCIKCGICSRVCPNNNKFNKKIYQKSKAYISYTKNASDKNNSSSGGMFFPIVRYVIEENKGVVFGVEMTEDLLAKHSYAETMEEAKKFQGSKYVKSDLNNSYKETKKFLDEGRLVLFSGTPCQCAGLRSFLGKKYDNLITCEIICHANPSPKVFKMYLENIKKEYNKDIKMIYFRSKETGWRNQVPVIEFNDESKINENSYFKAFTSELINRPSCYNCNFATKNRYSDFTIGDFWGIEYYDVSIKDDDTGISLFCVNTEKGNNIFKHIEDKIFYKEADISKAFSYNHHKNSPINKNRKKLFENISLGNITKENIIQYLNKYNYKPFTMRIERKIKKVKNKLRKQAMKYIKNLKERSD